MTRYLHTMYRITDPERSRAFYEALGLEFRREGPIVRNGELEATLYFFGVPGQEEELELTYNTDGRTYDIRSRHLAIVGETWLDIGIPEPGETEPIADFVETVPLDQIDRVERLPAIEAAVTY